MRLAHPLSRVFPIFALGTVLGFAPPTAAELIRGDVDGSAVLDISDAVRVLGFLFLGDRTPGCLDAADANDSGEIDIADASYLLSYLFSGGKAPPRPFPDCGADETRDALDCAASSGCGDLPVDPRPVVWGLRADPGKLPRPQGQSVFAVRIEIESFDPDGDLAAIEIFSIAPDGAKTARTFPAESLRSTADPKTLVHQVAYGAASALGAHEHRVRLIDAAGHESETATVRVELTAGGAQRIEIASFEPAAGGDGDVVLLRGAGLDAASVDSAAVSFSGARAEIVAITAAGIRCRVPPGAVTGPVQVSTQRGTALSAASFRVRPSLEIRGAGDDALVPLEKRTLAAVVTGLADRSVRWWVDGIAGGSAAVGTLDKSGLYTAPAVPPPAGEVTVRAVALADDAAAAELKLRLAPATALRGAGVVRAAVGGRIGDESGLVAISFPAGDLSSDLKVTTLTARLLSTSDKLPGIATGAIPLAVIDLQASGTVSWKGATFEATLPTWTPPKTPHSVLVFDGKSFVDTQATAVTTGTGVAVTGFLPRLGTFAIVRPRDAIVVVPPIQFPGPEVQSVEGPTDGVDEGLTVPVLVRGKRFWQSFTRVRADDPGLSQDLEFGPVLVNPAGTELGFTLRIKPMPSLGGGQRLPVAFRIQRLSATGAVTGEIVTDPNDFVIRGLPELVVAPDPASTVFTVDGLRVDRLLDDSNRYSTLVVERGAVLGIGQRVGSIRLGDGIPVDLRTLDNFELLFGILPWVADRNLDRSQVRIFQPANRLVWLDVTGPVTIDGAVLCSGMRGGENASLDHASGPGFGRLGGLASGTVSGGSGGDGGRSSFNATQNGQYAGNGVRERGVGHGAGGAAVAQLVAAGFGARFDPQLVELDGFVNTAIAAVNPFNPPAGLLDIAKRAANLFVEASNLATTASLDNNPPDNIVAGQGGHGGLRGTNAAPEMPDDGRVVPGSGGGGGGGGGSSAYDATLFGFSIDAAHEVGGGGAGGGGAGGALRITTSSLFTIGTAGRIEAIGGRGGAGEPHRWMGSPGGSGGGGAGGSVKLQATRFLAEGAIDISGGERAGALLGQTASPAPDYPNGRVQALQDEGKGGFLYYGCRCPWIATASPTVRLCWPTGRKRAEITFPFLTGILGIGTATQVHLFPIPTIPPARNGLLIIDDDRKVWFTAMPDFMAPNPEPSFSAELVDLIGETPLFGLTPTDIAQSPVPPYHYFISGVRGPTQDVAPSEILEFDLSWSFVRTVFSADTAEILGGGMMGHLSDIDFLSDGRLVCMMARLDPIEMGIHVIDVAAGTSTLLLESPDFSPTILRSFSVIRGATDQFLASLGTTGPSPGIARYDANGKTAHAALALETISEPGVPGLLRVDGGLAASNAPRARFDGFELPDLIYDGQPVGFRSPAIGSFAGAATAATSLESLVFGSSRLNVHCQGSEPGEAAELWRSSATSAPIAVPTPLATVQGQMQQLTALDEGFNVLWVETNRGGATHGLLQRHVLYIKDANLVPPRGD